MSKAMVKASQILLLLCFLHTSLLAQISKTKLNDFINKKETDELNPRLSLDGSKLYFSRSNSSENVGGEKAGQDIYVSLKNQQAEWLNPLNLGKPLNNVENNSIGGFVNANNRVYLSNLYGNAQQGISFSEWKDGKYSKPKPVFENNEITDNGFLSFCVTPDDRFMIISMNTDEVHNEDLFVSIHLEGGWTKPKTLGKLINTNGLEIAPFLLKDNKTLFFASNGLKGLGDYDIYMSKRLDDSWTNWTSPINLGPKVNTSGFDAYLMVDTNLTIAYFCSSESIGKSSDIFSIPFNEILFRNIDTLRLTTNTNKKLYGTIEKLFNKDYHYFSGAKSIHLSSLLEVTEQADFLDYVPQQNYFGYDTLRTEFCKTKEKQKCDSFIVIVDVQRQSMAIRNIVTDAVSKKPISASIVLNNDTLIKLKKIESTFPFEFTSELKPFTKNQLTILQDGYMPQVFNYDLTDSLNSFTINNEVALVPLAVGGLFGLNNIFFETGMSIIKEQSFMELDQLAAALVKNPKWKIFISGHTDNKGAEAANQKLSDDRVKSVIAYLLSKNVSKTQVDGKGFGSTKPIAPNDTEEGRNKNRRVDFTIQKM